MMAADPQPAVAPRRATQPTTALAIDLGWRVAMLHALRPSEMPVRPVDADMLLNRRSLAPRDRVELELRAVVGVARRLDVPIGDDALAALLGQAATAADSPAAETAFRGALAGIHVTFAKLLWSRAEADGRAYELGNFVADTWNRIQRPRTTDSPERELREVFGHERVRRVKRLIDELQARIDPAAAQVVSVHLDAWQRRVHERRPLAAAAGTEPFEPVHRQAVIWHQMLTGAKEPEAYIDEAKRAAVRDELLRQLTRRYRRLRYVLPLVALIAVGALAGVLFVNDRELLAAAVGAATAAGGAVGVTRATVTSVVRRGLQGWSELMWNRALTAVIARETLVVDELLEPPPAARRVSRRSRP